MTVCNVCGSSDLNLIDGFYYCVECGTQDTEARLTELETKEFEVNPFLKSQNARVEVTKVRKQVETENNVQMSGEWHKWHAYNFILCGMADELIGLGAKPSFKRKLLWIWSRYVRRYQIKEDFGAAKRFDDKNNTAQFRDQDSEDEVNNDVELNKILKNEPKTASDIKLFTSITIKLLMGMINAALNLDRNNILPSHLVRFIEEGKISAKQNNYWRLLPKEICTKNIVNWLDFYASLDPKLTATRIINMTYMCMHYLNLGTPVLPDMRNLLNNCVKELCLPNEFKDLVVSLIHMFPCHLIFTKFRIKGIPDYEAFMLGYIMVGLKICFGLDSDYDVRLTDVVDKINIEQEYEKSFKGVNSVPTGRLFSLREWYNHLQIRELMLSKHFKAMSSVLNFPCDDYVVFDQTERGKFKSNLTSELIADIVNKIPLDVPTVIPKSDFPATLTHMTDHTEVIAQYVMDPDIKMLLLEDFTQYSLKYACKKLKLKHLANDSNDLFNGVNESHKIIKGIMEGNWSKKVDKTKVYVRNCENKNWMVTKPPTLEHINDENVIDTREIDHDCNPNGESSLNQSEDNTAVDTDFQLYINSEETNIFDDAFDDIDDEDVKEDLGNLDVPEPDLFMSQPEWNETHGVQDSASEIDDHSDSSLSDNERERYKFNPETFDRQQVIKELILMVCNKHKISVPKEYKNNSLKRKWIDGGVNENKRKKTDLSDTKTNKENDNLISVTDILSSYYESVKNDVITKISEDVRTAILNANENNEILQNEPENIEDIAEGNVANDVEVIEEQNTDVILDDGLKEDDSDVHSDDTNEDIDVHDLLPREDPNFDGKTHEQDQLYLKVNSRFDDKMFRELFIIEDDEISDVLKEKVVNANGLTIPEDQHSSDYDSEDDLPVGVFKEMKNLITEREEKQEVATKYLFKNRADIKTFKYWMRFYTNDCTRNHYKAGSNFDKDLHVLFPGSFHHVLRKCSHILNVPTISVYVHMCDLENRMVFYAKKQAKLNASFT